MYVFVYGTLMSGHTAHSMLKGCEFIGHATTNGKLYDLGLFPGLKDGGGTVHGELYRVDSETLSRLDDYEGYRIKDVDSLYVREVRTVHVAPDKVYYANAYLINREVADYEAIPSGDWRNRGVDDGDEEELDDEEDYAAEVERRSPVG
jgi:gamma-glutamylcyclotransferase (GGCT)/AIG2-like uncharacterized protein YtfP